MADLTNQEKRKLERLFGMSSGYVMKFSDRTFQEFVKEAVGLAVLDERFNYASGSKANRLRAIWAKEPNPTVGRLTAEMIEFGVETEQFPGQDDDLVADCRRTAERLLAPGAITDADALTAGAGERDFEVLAREVQEAIRGNRPEAGLDRLHTFVMKLVRGRCQRRGIEVGREKPLHSLFGEYVKALQKDGLLETEMAARILKSSISVLDAFNDVRNDRSLAHDNPVTSYDESVLIFSHVAASIRFLKTIEDRAPAITRQRDNDDVPF